VKCPWPQIIQRKIRDGVVQWRHFKCRLVGDVNRYEMNEEEFELASERILIPLLNAASYVQIHSLAATSSDVNVIQPFLRAKAKKMFIDPTCDPRATAAFWNPKERTSGDVVFSVPLVWCGWERLFEQTWDPTSVRNPGAAISRSALTSIKSGLANAKEVFVCLPAVNSRTMLFTFAATTGVEQLYDIAATNCRFWTGA
jgi:hypothetical protein